LNSTERKRLWRERNPDRERALSRRCRAEWYARGGWAKDEQRHRLQAQADRRTQLKELHGEDE
jgi:hypothetical protein